MAQALQSPGYWEENVDGYVATAEPFTALFCADAVALAEIEPGVELLDVATGPGALALAAEAAGARVTAIDFSQSMIKRLTERARGRRIIARQMDGQALDFPSEAFDRACSVFGIPLFPDWRAGLAEMRRVLRPGGLAVVAVANNTVGFGPNTILAEARAERLPDVEVTIGIEGMAALSSADGLRLAMREAGFASVEIHERSHDFDFGVSIFTDGGAMLEANPVLAGLRPGEREPVIARARSIAEAERRGDRLRRKCTALIAVAR